MLILGIIVVFQQEITIQEITSTMLTGLLENPIECLY